MLFLPCIAKHDTDFLFFVNSLLKLAQSMKFTTDVISISQQICLSVPSFIAGVSKEVYATLFKIS